MIVFLKEFQGIFGAVVGVVVTLISTEFIRRWGKVSFSVSDYELEFYKEHNNFGSVSKELVEEFNMVDIFKYTLKLALYNSSDVPHSLYDIWLEFIDENGSTYKHKPYDDSKTRPHPSGGPWHHEYFGTVELEPKRLNIIILQGWIRKEELVKLTRTTKIDKVFFRAKNQTNKEIRKKIIG